MQVNPIGRGRLTVTFQEGQNLHDCKVMGTQSPGVEFHIGKDKLKSPVCHNGGKNPKWNYSAVIDLQGNEHTLSVEVYHHGLMEHEFIGKTDVPLMELVKTYQPTWYQLVRGDHQKEAGNILISNVWQPNFDPNNPMGSMPQGQMYQQQQPPQMYQQPPPQVYQPPQMMAPQQVYQQPQQVYQQPQQVYQQPQQVFQPQGILQGLEQAIQGAFGQGLKNPQVHHVALRTHNGALLHAIHGHRVDARGQMLDRATTWAVHHHGQHVALQSEHGRFLCAEQNGSVVADRQQVGDWEKFFVEDLNDGQVALRTFHNTYLGIGEGNVEQRGNLGHNERFRVEYID